MFAVNLYPTFFVRRPFGSFVPSQVDGGIKPRQKSQRGPFWNPWRVSGLLLKSGVTEKPGWCGGGKCFLSFSHNMHICWNLFMSVVTYELTIKWHNCFLPIFLVYLTGVLAELQKYPGNILHAHCARFRTIEQDSNFEKGCFCTCSMTFCSCRCHVITEDPRKSCYDIGFDSMVFWNYYSWTNLCTRYGRYTSTTFWLSQLQQRFGPS